MATIQVKFDNTLEQSDIIIPLIRTSEEEAGDAYTSNQPEVQQTLVYGIQCPLIMINNIVVDFCDVINFELSCIGDLPEVTALVRDRSKLTSVVDTPSIDNELRVQILPKFEDKYKKINLTFYITSIKFFGDNIKITASYKLPKFTSDNIKSFGEISTYQLFENIAQEVGLGFASNVSGSNDKRYIYCDNRSYQNLLQKEIARSGSDLQLYTYWIDWWNNLVLADIYERYNAKDKDEDMMIWIADQQKEMTEGNSSEPVQSVALFHNHPATSTSELYVSNYSISNSPGHQMYSGTDKLYSVYSEDKLDYADFLIQDGDSKKDIYTKFEYLGEVYGEFDYLLAGKKRDAFLQKINSNETVEITLKTPLLGVMRGNKCNFMWYVNDSFSEGLKNTMDEAGVTTPDPQTTVPIKDDATEGKNGDGEFTVDKSISGQYLITGCKMKYSNEKWEYIVTLSRPTIDKPKIINEE